MRRRQVLAVLILVGIGAVTLYDGIIWFLGFLLVLATVILWIAKMKHNWRRTRARIDMELERAHHQSQEYDWRPWARPDYLERRRR